MPPPRAAGFGDEGQAPHPDRHLCALGGFYDAYYKQAQKVRRLVARDFERALAECDVILAPTTTGRASFSPPSLLDR